MHTNISMRSQRPRHRYRTAAAHALASDFMSARAGDVEIRLWNAHNRLNVRLRKQLSKVGFQALIRLDELVLTLAISFVKNAPASP